MNLREDYFSYLRLLFKSYLIDLLGHQLNGNGEHNGGVLLGGDGGEGLEIPQLEGSRALRDDVTCLLQRFAGLLFSLGSDNLKRTLQDQVSCYLQDLTLARASLEASASAAMALCRLWGSLTSFTSTLWI